MSPFPTPLREARLVRRYRRFLADVRFRDGSSATVHCANPGAMTGCDRPGSPVLLSRGRSPRRKLPWTWELVRVGRTWVSVNTAVANRMAGRWLGAGRLLPGRGPVRREVRVAGSRFDFELGDGTLVEVKTVTLERDGIGAFPDSVTERGRRHLETLARLRGRERVLLYFVARGDLFAVRPADEIDPRYGAALRAAADAGVEVRAVGVRFGPQGVVRRREVQVIL